MGLDGEIAGMEAPGVFGMDVVARTLDIFGRQGEDEPLPRGDEPGQLLQGLPVFVGHSCRRRRPRQVFARDVPTDFTLVSLPQGVHLPHAPFPLPGQRGDILHGLPEETSFFFRVYFPTILAVTGRRFFSQDRRRAFRGGRRRRCLSFFQQCLDPRKGIMGKGSGGRLCFQSFSLLSHRQIRFYMLVFIH